LLESLFLRKFCSPPVLASHFAAALTSRNHCHYTIMPAIVCTFMYGKCSCRNTLCKNTDMFLQEHFPVSPLKPLSL
jgi:hypothetical protein